jgi:septum formation protein
MEIILASGSPRRSALLERWGISFTVIPARDVDELSVTGSPSEVAALLSEMKARSVLDRLRGETLGETLVIGADTLVEVGGRPLGKPADLAQAREMIERLSGRTHRVVTGVAVVRSESPARVEVETSEVSFRPLARAEIERYLSTGDWEGKAGAYGIQDEGQSLVAGFRGCFYNIVGLPMRRLAAMLAAEGAAVCGAGSCDCGLHPLQWGEWSSCAWPESP